MPKRAKEAITEYKRSPRFKLALQKSGQVTYEFGCRLALVCFWAKYLDLEVEPNSFADLPKDQGIEMPNEVPFNESPLVPPS